MLKRTVFRELDVNVLNLENVLREVNRRELTGFLRVVYWDKDDFLLFSGGLPFKAVTVRSDGRRISYEPQNFRLEPRDGNATLVETSLDDLVAFQEYRHSPERDGALVFFPYGTVVQEPVSVGFLDINRQFLLAQRSHLYGYMALFTEENLIGLVIFHGGLPVAVVGGNGTFGESAVDYINSTLVPAESRMSMYSLEPELLTFLYSLRPGGVSRVDSVFMTYQEAESYVVSEGRSAVVLMESEGIYRYDLFFQGQHVERVVKDRGFPVTDEEEKGRLSLKVENIPGRKISLYEIRLIDKVSPLEVVFESTAVASETSDLRVPQELVDQVKSAFVEEMGPLGRLLWDRTLESMGFRETSLNRKQMRLLVDRLRKEIPEEEAGRRFARKIKEFLPDII